jgi:hypothetical protein
MDRIPRLGGEAKLDLTEQVGDGVLRRPCCLGLRDDKPTHGVDPRAPWEQVMSGADAPSARLAAVGPRYASSADDPALHNEQCASAVP